MLRSIVNALPKALRRQKLLTALYKSRIASPVQLADFNGNARAYLDLRDAESRAVYLSQSFWPEFHPIVAAFLRNGGEMFDVGANFGLVTFGVLPLVAGQKIGFHLFEANPNIVPLLKRSAALWHGERFTVNHACVSDRAGASRLTLPDACWGHAYIGDEGFEIRNLILDDYIERNTIKRIAFMKMDIEGSEPRALRGMSRALAAGVVQAAFIEVGLDALHRAGSSGDELLGLLDRLGFDLYFCGMWDYPDPYNLNWIRFDVNGTSLRFAPARPLPSSYTSGDVMALHRSTRFAANLSAR
jgi:FkbM family methyltransferase